MTVDDKNASNNPALIYRKIVKMLALLRSRRVSWKKCFENIVVMWLETSFYILFNCKKKKSAQELETNIIFLKKHELFKCSLKRSM